MSQRHGHRRSLKELRTAGLFLLPLVIFYLGYYGYSFVFLGRVSQQKVSLSFLRPVEVGMRNIRLVLTDPLFHRAVINTLLFALIATIASLTVGFGLSVMMATGVKAKRWYFAVFLLPSLVPVSLFASVFGDMLQTDDGAFNRLFRSLHLDFLEQDWLTNTRSAYIAVAILLVYGIGLPILYYTADLSTFDTSVIEAALIDGAGTWTIFRSMVYPLMRYTHRTVILSAMLGSFRGFDNIYFSTAGAPGGRTSVAGVYIYNATLGPNRVGYAAAASLCILALAIVISFIAMMLTRRRGAL